MVRVRSRRFGILVAGLFLLMLTWQSSPAFALTTVTRVAVVAGDSTGGISAIATQGGQKLIEDAFGKTLAVYVDGTGRVAATYANSNPAVASSWAPAVKSPGTSFGYHRPAAVLVSSSSLRIIAEDGTGVGHINDLPVTISRDASNNIVGLSFGTRVSLDTSGGAHYPAAVLAHNGDILAVWWQNATTSSIVKSFRWRPGIEWRGFGGSTTVPDNAIVDSTNTFIIYPSLIQRVDNRHVYLFGNRDESSPAKNLVFNKATFGGTNWTWGTQNLAYDTNAARGLFDVPSLAWDPIRQLVVVIHDISGFERYAAFTLNSADVRTNFDTPTLNIANNEWGNIEVFEPTGDYYIFMIDSVDPVVNHDNGRIGFIRYNGASWETSLTIIDADTNNVGISMRRTGSNSTMDFLYTDSGGSPKTLKFVRIFQAENVSTYTFPVTDDASVMNNATNQNFGSASALEIDSSPIVKHFLLKFQLAGLTGHQIFEAKLRLFVNPDSGAESDRGGDFYKTSNSWNENNVTWNNAPPADPGLVASLGAVSRATWYEVDITPIVTGSGPLNVKVLPASSNGADYSSSEGANPPQLVILAENLPPVLSPVGNKSVGEETTLTFAATATDPDSDPLIFSLGPGAPAGATITSGGVFSWTPAESQGLNNYQVTVVVSDGNLSDNETITVAVSEVNGPPSLTVPGPQTVDEGTVLTFTVTASDPDLPANTITLSSSGLPLGANFSASTGVFSWTPSEAQGPGDYIVTFTATDNGSPPLSTSSSVTIHVNEVNLAPVLNTPGDQTTNELGSLTFIVSATDPDGPSNIVTLACTDCAAIGATFNSSSGQFSWSPSEQQGPGNYVVTFTATDNGSPVLSNTKTLNIQVLEVNEPPTISVPGSQTVQEGSALSFSLTAFDPDLPPNSVALSGSGLPAGASFNQSSGAFSWTPTLGQQGTYTITFTATDNGNLQLSDSGNVTITVTAAVLEADFSFSSSTAGKPTSFSANASGGTPPYTFFWDFGDESTGSGQTISHTYAAKGSYNATLTVTDSLNRTRIISQLVPVSAQPLSLSISASPASSGKPVEFTATIIGGTGPYVVSWNFGDASTGTGNPSVHSYSVKGIYTVNATVTDANGASATASMLITVSPQTLTATVTASLSASSGKPVTFTSTISGGTSPYSVAWNFGDGTTASGATTEHVYSTKGTYTVTANVTEANGANAVATISLVIQPQQLTADFALAPATAGKPVNFTATATGGTSPYTFSWDFGDGTSNEAGQSVPHTYTVKGTYTVSLTVTDSNSNSITVNRQLTVAPQSVTVTTIVSGTATGEPVSFSASASGGTGPYSITWDFGDGSTATGSSVSHAYSVKGPYTWSVLVTDANGESTVSGGTVSVDPQPLQITLQCDPATSGKPVSCTASTSGGTSPYTINWDVGNDTIVDGSGPNFTTTFAIKGTYVILASATDSNTVSTMDTVFVNVQQQPLTAEFTFNPASLIAGKPATFEASASGGTAPYTFEWSFGDGTLGEGASSVHAYATKGSYAIVVNVTDANGVLVSTTTTLTVAAQPLLTDFTFTSATAGKPVSFNATASGGTSPYLFSWSIGDGTGPQTGSPTSHIYSVKGTYSIVLTVTDSNGANATAGQMLYVSPQGLIISAACQNGTAGKPASCNASASGGTSPYTFAWDLGNDGTIDGTGDGFTQVFPVKGAYTIEAIVTDANNVTARVSLSVQIGPQPLAATFTFEPAVPTAGKPVNFGATASGGTGPYLFVWSLGDLSSETGSTVTHTYALKGSFIVSLTVSDANNVTVTVSQQLLVTAQPLAIVASCQAGTAGKPTNCDAFASGGTAPYMYLWDIGKDGTIDGQGQTFTTVFPVNGTFSLDAVVVDANNATSVVNIPILVGPQPLVISATCQPGTAGKPTSCDASASGGTAPYTFSWDVGKDGTIDGQGQIFTAVFPVKGTFSIDAIVTDANGATSFVNLPVLVAPQPLAITASCQLGTAGKPTSCDFSASGGTSPYSFQWDVGKDGTIDGNSQTFTIVFPVKGSYSVDAIVVDANNATAMVNLPINVGPQPLAITATCQPGTAGKPVDCATSSTGGTEPYLFSWDVGGDGSKDGTGPNFSTTFSVKGGYSIEATVTDANGQTASILISVTVSPQSLVTDFVTSSPRLVGQPVTFTGTSSGGTAPYLFLWDFGDGTSGSGVSVSHTFTIKGVYTVTLTVADANNATVSLGQLLGISEHPISLIALCNDGTAGKPLTCNASASGGTTPYLFEWAFSDGGTATGSSVSHTFTLKGVYSVEANVTDANLAFATTTFQLSVAPQPLEPSMNLSPSSPTVGEGVTFSASASGGTIPYSFSWSLGDGSAASGSVVSHTYSVKGTYAVSLTVTDVNGANANVTRSAHVSGQPLIVSLTTTNTTAGKPVTFSVAVSGGTAPYAISWDLGDGYTGTGEIATHTYSVKGSYNITANVTDANLDSTAVTAIVAVTPQTFTLTVSCSPGTSGKPLSCVADVAGGTPPYTFSWDVGKDGTIDGAGTTFIYTFAVKGSYSIDVVANDSNGETASTNVVVIVQPQPLTVTAECPAATAGKPFTCSASASGGTLPYVFGWDTGKDGSFEATGSSFTWSFPVKGSYSIDAVVIDANGDIARLNLPVTVSPQALTISVGINAQPAGKPTTFDASVAGGTGPYEVYWSFGDGSSGSGSQATHVYAVKGLYNVAVNASDANGASIISTMSINIDPQPLAVTAQCANATSGKPTVCEASVSGGTLPYDVSWAFSDGGTGSGTSTSHVFAAKGIYVATANVTDSNLAFATTTFQVSVAAQPLRADLETSTSPRVGEPVTLTALPSGGTGPYLFSWYFADSFSANGNPVSHTYTVKGTYNVTLTVTDANNVTGTVGVPVLVSPEQLTASVPTASGTAGKPVTLSVTAFGGTGPYTVAWDLGDQSNGTGQTISHVYSTKGSYTVVATVTDSNSATVSAETLVVVNPQALVITASCGSGTAGKPVECNATATGGTAPYAFSWDVGKDGTVDGQGQAFGIIFPVKGTYTIDAIVVDANNATAMVNLPIIVGPQPLAITATCQPMTAGKPTGCDSSATGGTAPYAFSWDVGKDGTIDGQGASFTVVFPVKGTYSIDAIVTDANNATAFVNLPIVVSPQVLVITASCQAGTAGKPTDCTSSASGGTQPYTFLWDVGKDGVIDGQGQVFTTVFPVKGTYSIDAIAVDANNATAFVNLPISVGAQSLIITASCQPGTAGKPTTCSASATGGTLPYVFSWDLGKDGFIEGTGEQFSVVFPVKGSYSVDAIVSDANAVIAFVNLPVVVQPQPLGIDFTHDATLVVGSPVNFSASVTGGTAPYIFSWTFGDGLTGTGTPVTHTYTVKGFHAVTLNVTDANGVLANVEKVVLVEPQPLQVTVSVSLATAGNPVDFTATVDGGTGPYAVSWDFGDGTNGTGNPASHTYSVKGLYNVTVLVTDTNGVGAISSLIVSVTVQPLTVTAQCATGTAGQPFSCEASASGGTAPHLFAWLFSDNGTATGSVVTYTYPVKGSYTASVTVTDANNSSATTTVPITITPEALTGDFTMSARIAPAGGSVTFSASVSGGTAPYSVLWDFGDNTTGTGSSVSHAFSVEGSYRVTMTVTDMNGATASVARTLLVGQLPGDATNDCAVNVDDLARVGAQFGKVSTDPGFDTNADLNNDGAINVDDLAIVGLHFGTTCY